jgi:hypothetical protein
VTERFFIFCDVCAREKIAEDADPRFLLAMFGPQGLTDEDAVLVCVPWAQRARPIAHLCQPFVCDGCRKIVSVAPSSRWFIDRHRAERV